MIVRIMMVLIFNMIFIVCLFAQTDEQQIRQTMENWKQAIMVQDVEAIVEFYSDNFTSMDGNGKEGARQTWQEIKELGYLEKIEINLQTARIEIKDNTAEILIYNDEGEVEMDFALAKEDGKDWVITGIPSETCSYDKYNEPYGDGCVQHDGYYRCWDILVPSGLKGLVPLIIDIHGWQHSPSIQRAQSGFESLAVKEGFIVAWPFGLCKSWNSGEQCCAPASEKQIDDVGFIRKMIKEIAREYPIDLNRVYLSGLSNGSALAQRLAIEASDVIAAAASMSLHLLVSKASDYSPIPVMTLMGTKDDLYHANEDMPGAKENFDTWKTMNNCSGEYQVSWRSGNSVAWTYTDCANDSEVTLVAIDGGGHVLYKGKDTEINTTKLAWDFLNRFSK